MMQQYQEQLIKNMEEIEGIKDFFAVQAPDFSTWYQKQQEAKARIKKLRAENNGLLKDHLFPALDDLFTASPGEIEELDAFAKRLMSGRAALDSGISVVIFSALLRLYRYKKDRNNTIKELYQLGMSLYLQGRGILGVESEATRAFQFKNEMVFTEGGTYLKFFDDIDDEETKGYIIRSLANIAIATSDVRKRVRASSKVLKITQDEYYRAQAPSLPWDTFTAKTHQQMSSNRRVLSRGGLNSEELSEILESCQFVFQKQEKQATHIRWLWPSYEMEYSLGLADLAKTLSRLEKLILSIPYTQRDDEGLYAHVQLPMYYGRLLRANRRLLEKPEHVSFFAEAVKKALDLMLTYPKEQINTYFLYCTSMMITEYLEIDEIPSYKEITLALMERYGGALYIEAKRSADLMAVFSQAVMQKEPGFFDDIPFIQEISDPKEKEEAVISFAYDCGIYHDFGLIKMNFEKITSVRDLFEEEEILYEQHTVSGHDDLAVRPSTRKFSDTALGHHSWYNGQKGYPESYQRNESPYRQMTDLMAIVVTICDSSPEDLDHTIEEILSLEGTRYSPMLTRYLVDPALTEKIRRILENQDIPYYKALYDKLIAAS